MDPLTNNAIFKLDTQPNKELYLLEFEKMYYDTLQKYCNTMVTQKNLKMEAESLTKKAKKTTRLLTHLVSLGITKAQEESLRTRWNSLTNAFEDVELLRGQLSPGILLTKRSPIFALEQTTEALNQIQCMIQEERANPHDVTQVCERAITNFGYIEDEDRAYVEGIDY